MTAVALADVRRPREAAPPITLSRVTAVELRKMFDTRSGFWLMASIFITALLATVGVIAFAPDRQLTYLTFAKTIGFPMAFILPIIALLSVTSEWSQRSGLTTFTLVPQRSRVIAAKAISVVAVGVISMLLAFAIGAVGNLVGAAVNGTPLVWDLSLTHGLTIVLGNVLGLLTGFMLGVVIRNSPGALVANFGYFFVLPTAFGYLAANQGWFQRLQPWVDASFAQAPLFDGSLAGAQWAHLAVTGLCWLIVPLAAGVALVMRSEIK